ASAATAGGAPSAARTASAARARSATDVATGRACGRAGAGMGRCRESARGEDAGPPYAGRAGRDGPLSGATGVAATTGYSPPPPSSPPPALSPQLPVEGQPPLPAASH